MRNDIIVINLKFNLYTYTILTSVDVNSFCFHKPNIVTLLTLIVIDNFNIIAN